MKNIVVTRTDGLGTRLCAMVNGLDVAKKLKLPFKFSWSSATYSDAESHAIKDAKAFFADDFVDQHFDPTIDHRRYVKILDAAITKKAVAKVTAADELDGFLINHWSEAVNIEGVKLRPKADLIAGFKAIRFSDRINAAMDKAKAVVPAGSVAIHCRRGDLVYGDYRKQLYNQKYAPSGMVKTIVRNMNEIGKKPIIFSDDPRIIAMLKRDFDVTSTEELGGLNFKTSDEVAMFDIAAMIQCDSIISTRSGFAVIASFANGRPLHNISTFYGMCQSRHDILTDIRENPDDYTPLDRAKSLQYVANQLRWVLKDGERDALLSEASAIDPTNQAYPHIRAKDMLDEGRIDEAEAILAGFSETYFQSTQTASSDLASGFDYIQIGDHKHMAKAIKHRLPFLTAYAAHFAPNPAEAATLSAKAYHALPGSPLLAVRWARHLVDAGRPDDARAFLLSTKQRLKSAAAYEILGDLEPNGAKAIQWYELAVSTSPEWTVFEAKLAGSLHASGVVKRAREIAEKLSIQNHQNPSTYYFLAKFYVADNRLDLARESIDAAVAMRPSRQRYLNLQREISAMADLPPTLETLAS